MAGESALSRRAQHAGCALAHLDLSFNALRGGVKYIADGLALCRSLVSLDLTHTGIGNVGATALGLALCDNASLRRLDVSQVGWSVLARAALNASPPAQCRINAQGARGLAMMLSVNRTLVSLTVRAGTRLRWRGVDARRRRAFS